MKKILLSILLLTASTLIYSQSMDLNHKKIHIVDSTMGLGITPTSRLHVFGNGTSSNMFNLTNDKDGVKDSSVIIDAIGNVGIGKIPHSRTKLDVGGQVRFDSSLYVKNDIAVDSNIHLTGLLSEIRFNRGGNISSPGHLCKFTGMGITIDKDQYYAIHFNRVLSSNNDTIISLGNDHLNVDNYSGYVGIGTSSANSKLHIYGNGADLILFNATNDKDATKDSSFVIHRNGYVGIGSNVAYYPLHVWGSAPGGANIYSEYNGSTLSSAIKGYASGTYGFGIIGEAHSSATGGLFKNNGSGKALEAKSVSGYSIVTTGGDVVTDSTRNHNPSMTLHDNDIYALPTSYSWKGEIDVDSLGYTLFTVQVRCDVNGTVYIEGVSWKRWSSITYTENGTTDGYFNIYDAGSGMAIKNSLGYTIKATLRFRTKQ